MTKEGLAAIEIGKIVGATAQEVNRLLADQGFLAFRDGFYRITEKGSAFAVEVLKSSSNLPQAKTWTATYWRPEILKELVSTQEKLAPVRAVLADERAARSAARMAERAAQNALRLAPETPAIAEAAKVAVRRIRVPNGLGACAAGAVVIGLTGLAVYARRKTAGSTGKRV